MTNWQATLEFLDRHMQRGDLSGFASGLLLILFMLSIAAIIRACHAGPPLIEIDRRRKVVHHHVQPRRAADSEPEPEPEPSPSAEPESTEPSEHDRWGSEPTPTNVPAIRQALNDSEPYGAPA